MASTSIVKHTGYSLEAAEHEKEELDKAPGGSRFAKLVTGRNLVRVLPPLVSSGRKSPFLLTYQHILEIPGITNPVSFNCPRVMAKKPCPACAKMEELRATGQPADYNRAGKFFPKLRVYANVIMRAAPENGPQVLPFGKTIHEQLIAIRADTSEGGDFTDPTEDGFDIIIEKEGEGLNTKYKVRPARSATELGDMSWIEQQANLEQYARVPTVEEIRDLMDPAGTSGGAGDRGGGRPRARAQEAEPAPARGAGRGKRRTAEDDADDVDDE